MLGDDAGARRDLERALAIYESKLGANHPDVARPLDALATMARRSNDLDRAGELLRRVIRIKETNMGVDHPELVVSLVNLGVVERDRGDLITSGGRAPARRRDRGGQIRSGQPGRRQRPAGVGADPAQGREGERGGGGGEGGALTRRPPNGAYPV